MTWTDLPPALEAPNGFLTVIFAADAWDGEPVNAEPRKHAQVA